MANKKVIYTSLTGGYDNLPQYICIDEGFDFLCFSNDFPEGTQVGIWTIRNIPFKSDNLIRLSRYVKLLPHRVLQNYEYSIWIDSNLIISNKQPYERFTELIQQNTKWASIVHPTHDCIYKDARQCIRNARAPFKDLKKQVLFLRKEGYPANNGLFENNVIVRRHNDPNIVSLSEDWWKLYCEYSSRDQLSLCYVFWKHNFKPDLIYPADKNTKNVSGFVRLPHIREPFIIWCYGFLKRKTYRIRLFFSNLF